MVMAGPESTVRPIAIYRNYGDTPPDFETLLPLYERQLHIIEPIVPTDLLEFPILEPPPNLGGGVSRDLLLGDLCRDLADARREQRDQWLGRAKSHLRDARDVGKIWVERGPRRRTDDLHQNVAAAAVRLIDTPTWEAALAGKPVSFDYEAIIKACAKVYQFVDHRASGVEDAMAEALPMIAVAHQGAGSGRHALYREDQQNALHSVEQRRDAQEPPPSLRRRNPRWDCSLTRSTHPDDLVTPPRRIQVKRLNFRPGTNASANAYLNGNVLPVCTANFGWASPRAVIASCAIALGLENPRLLEGLDRSSIMSPSQLEDSFGNAMHYLLDASIEEVAEAVNQ